MMSARKNFEVPEPEEGVSVYRNGILIPVLHEVRHALERLAQTGEAGVIDLRAMPFAPGEIETLFSILGDGEVTARINALGTSNVRETALHGVWIVDHLNPDGESIALQIEICDIPGILRSQTEDIAESLNRLDTELSTYRSNEKEGE